MIYIRYTSILKKKMDQNGFRSRKGRTWRLYGSMTEYEEPEQGSRLYQAREMAASTTKMADIRNTAGTREIYVSFFF